MPPEPKHLAAGVSNPLYPFYRWMLLTVLPATAEESTIRAEFQTNFQMMLDLNQPAQLRRHYRHEALAKGFQLGALYGAR